MDIDKILYRKLVDFYWDGTAGDKNPNDPYIKSFVSEIKQLFRELVEEAIKNNPDGFIYQDLLSALEKGKHEV